jgi:hypothetical protein
MVGFFERIGHRPVCRGAHPEYGDVLVMKLDLKDGEHLEHVRSPLMPIYRAEKG